MNWRKRNMEKNNVIEKYTYRVEWSEDDKVHIARCLEFPL